MSKVTSKLQLTVPKAIADQYGIQPGDDLEWAPAGDTIRVTTRGSSAAKRHGRSVEERLKIFDQATKRQRKASAGRSEVRGGESWKPHERARGWRREDLYKRGRPR